MRTFGRGGWVGGARPLESKTRYFFPAVLMATKLDIFNEMLGQLPDVFVVTRLEKPKQEDNIKKHKVPTLTCNQPAVWS